MEIVSINNNTKFEPISLRPIDVSTIHPVVLPEVLKWSTLYTREVDARVEDLKDAFCVDYGDGDLGFIVGCNKKYLNGTQEYSSFLLDLNQNEELTGRSEIRYRKEHLGNPYFKDKPFVGWTKTEFDFQRQGLGRRTNT